MNISEIPFGATDWTQMEQTEHEGETGIAYWRTRQFGSIRVRLLEYSPGYRADHRCSKGHLLPCLEGELVTELRDGRRFTLKPGMSYRVADRTAPFLRSQRRKAVRGGLKAMPGLPLRRTAGKPHLPLLSAFHAPAAVQPAHSASTACS